MKYFVVVMGVIFLAVIIFYEFILGFLGPAYRDHPDGFEIVSILLIKNLFLGSCTTYQSGMLTEKQFWGLYINI